MVHRLRQGVYGSAFSSFPIRHEFGESCFNGLGMGWAAGRCDDILICTTSRVLLAYEPVQSLLIETAGSQRPCAPCNSQRHKLKPDQPASAATRLARSAPAGAFKRNADRLAGAASDGPQAARREPSEASMRSSSLAIRAMSASVEATPNT